MPMTAEEKLKIIVDIIQEAKEKAEKTSYDDGSTYMDIGISEIDRVCNNTYTGKGARVKVTNENNPFYNQVCIIVSVDGGFYRVAIEGSTINCYVTFDDIEFL